MISFLGYCSIPSHSSVDLFYQNSCLYFIHQVSRATVDRVRVKHVWTKLD